MAALEGEGIRAAFVAVDATDPDSLESGRQAAEKRLGPVNVLVNAPGINSSTPFFDIALDEWLRILDANLTSARCCDHRGHGHAGRALDADPAAFNQPLGDDASPERRERQRDLLENYRALLAPAAARGVTILTGTDTAGTLVDEIRHLVGFGLTPVQALRAATTDARAFLGVPSIGAGAPADVVTFEEDPREEPAMLSRPAAVVLGGVRIA